MSSCSTKLSMPFVVRTSVDIAIANSIRVSRRSADLAQTPCKTVLSLLRTVTFALKRDSSFVCVTFPPLAPPPPAAILSCTVPGGESATHHALQPLVKFCVQDQKRTIALHIRLGRNSNDVGPPCRSMPLGMPLSPEWREIMYPSLARLRCAIVS